MIEDIKQREQAINVNQSFIVQAPAGSGKTELLTQRFLALLGNAVNHPEEIIAITFTRKAASEMRQRIVSALLFAKNNPQPEEAHKQTTWQLSQKVLERDKQNQWRILENPNRLKVTTIDSFCRNIVGQLPVLSHMGSQASITDAQHQLYQRAARATLSHLKIDDPWFHALQQLLISVDNDYERAEDLIIDMLSTRDQWIDYLGIPQEQAIMHLSTSLHNIITHNLEQMYSYFIDVFNAEELLPLVNFAYDNLYGKSFDYHDLPEPNLTHLPFWQFISRILLTDSGSARKIVNKNIGFPAASDAPSKDEKKIYTHFKNSAKTMLSRLESETELVQLLADIQTLPEANYYQDQNRQDKIFSLFNLLQLAYAELKLLFQRTNQVDFSEIALSANTALRNIENTPDITLILDYSLKHILIDEFQDTSRLQFSLLENLTREWMPDDNKTIFLVGDPMQSIYRFRQAEVGLFLQVQQYGINHLDITPLRLTCNFRSEKPVIDWVNQQFKTAFPVKSDIASGAIHYSASTPVKNNTEENSVSWHRLPASNTTQQHVLQIIKSIQTIQKKTPNASIAILARKRKHLMPILQMLSSFNIPFQAVDIESLTEKPIIHDLIALTCALNHLGDHLSWLSILRMPCIGLTLADLLIIAEHLNKLTVIDLLHSAEFIEKLSNDTMLILARVMPILEHAVKERQRFELRQWVEHTWLALGGGYALKNQTEQTQADSFFELLDTWPDDMLDLYSLKSALKQRYASTSGQKANIQLMTIHKSKGLEFDYVILPELQDKGQTDKSSILAWHEQPSTQDVRQQHYDWLLAAKKAVGEENDPMYIYIQKVNKEKIRYENTRLFYVAVTRAKHGLLLFYQQSEDENKPPAADSLLATVWNTHLSLASCDIVETNVEKNEENNTYKTKIQTSSLIASWQHPKSIVLHPSSDETENKDWQFDFSWELERKVGSIYHEFFKLLANKPELQQADKINQLTNLILLYLRRYHIPEQLHENYVHEIQHNLLQMLNDEKARWILNAEHNSALSEYPISLKIGKYCNHYIIDRTFIDKDNVRWIIDYKTSELNGLSLSKFTQAEWDKYLPQLETYARFFANLESNEIKLALYYPKSGIFLEKLFNIASQAISHEES